MSNSIVVKGKNGEEVWVSNGFGIGTREHDDVMLAYEYSHTVKKKQVSIPAGQYACLTLTIPANLVHHAEYRSLTVRDSTCEVAIVPFYTGPLPATDEPLAAWNQVGPTLNPDVKSIVSFRGVQASNPINITPNDQNCPDYGVLPASPGGFFSTATSTSMKAIAGRHYLEGIHVAWIHNVGSDTAIVDYEYGFHEFDKS